MTRLSAWVTARVGSVSDEARLPNSLAEMAGSNSSVVTVGDLAAALNVSTRTVHRLAAQYIGLTPHALIRRRRLQEAAEHIRSEPEASLSSVAAAHGFSDQAHFARKFQRFLGQTPREYRGAPGHHS
ncbi:helix-turn-helix transcriptional regulator [Kocuria sp. cx-116]|uniref:helix-turn-helix transcriptional regulator n=1 Tax=Kocuria sp. cx-116 TaxID=2771378 RepID=UPI0016862926|nr:helix-turn-helix transcriptional regulator [Kocuria sp. cx-116]MBD2763106.1 helix-turn-helix transcriptional regulator [Kocuria sp. cx-116]